MLDRFDPRQGQVLSLLDPEGSLDVPEGLARLPDELALKAYRFMMLSRQADEWAVNLNRQGRMATYPPNKGQEANAVGAMLAIRDDDWFVPAFRELGAWLVRGIPLKNVYLYWYGNELASHLPPNSYHTLPISVPVGSQPAHAVGLGYAEKLRGSDRIALTFMGEGATSEGAVHEALNLAAVWGVGVIFYVQNNQYAISVPTGEQTRSPTVAEKAFAYGFDGVRVDGNDLFAVYAAVSAAAEVARSQRRPTLVEGFTYRLGAHTTADDPRRYRDEEEVALWTRRDPLLRLERYMQGRGLLSAEQCESVRKDCLAEARRAFEEAERTPDPTLEDTFQHTFAELPAGLQCQLRKRQAR